MTDGTGEMRARRTVEVRNRHGLHARPAAEFVKLASSFEAEVMVRKDELEVNGKSIMGVMMLAASQGSTLGLHVEGEDEHEAARQLVDLVNGYFGEDE